jgi:hypothetical protein
MKVENGFKEFLGKLVYVELKTNNFKKGDLISIDEFFVKIKTLSNVFLIPKTEIKEIRLVGGQQ